MNNLIILFDSLSAASLGCYGCNAKTPAFDMVAANGDLFTHCYSDFSGKLIEEYVNQFPTQEMSEIETGIEVATSETQVIRIASKQNNQDFDELLQSSINHFTDGQDRDFNLVITALQGDFSKENSTKESQFPGEMAVHVPLIISLAHQEMSRRRLDLLTSQHVVQILKSLTTSNEAYHRFRDSMDVKQISYNTAKVLATRTRDWLHFRENHLDEHGESLQRQRRRHISSFAIGRWL